MYRGEGTTPEYRTLNPFGRIPTLVDGPLVLWESNAILVYVAEAWGEHRLWSREPRARAAIARWLFWESAHWQPAVAEALAPFVGHRLRPDLVPAPTAEPDWERPPLGPALSFLDTRLRGRPYLGGPSLTLADLAVAAMAMYFRPCGFPFASFPALAAWSARIDSLEAWRATAVDPWT